MVKATSPIYPGIEASSVRWGEVIYGTAREVLAEAEQVDAEAGETRDAVNWLRELLADGPIKVKDVRQQAEGDGFAWRSLQRAMRKAGVVSRRAGFGMEATWALTSSNATVAPVAPDAESGANGEETA